MEPGYLVNIASVYLPQDVILRLLAFLSEGFQSLVEALPPEENLGAGETAEEWGEAVIYPVETIRKRLPPPHLPGAPTPPPPARRMLGFLSPLRVSNPHCMYFTAG